MPTASKRAGAAAAKEEKPAKRGLFFVLPLDQD